MVKELFPKYRDKTKVHPCLHSFSEQGSSASQMTAAGIMDVIARLPDCERQAADAVSACTQVKIGGCSQNCSKF